MSIILKMNSDFLGMMGSDIDSNKEPGEREMLKLCNDLPNLAHEVSKSICGRSIVSTLIDLHTNNTIAAYALLERIGTCLLKYVFAKMKKTFTSLL